MTIAAGLFLQLGVHMGFAQQHPAPLNILVVDSITWAPLQDVLIVNNNIAEGTTGSDGRFKTRLNVIGTHQIRVNRDGYTTFSFYASAGDTFRLVKLAPLVIDIGEILITGTMEPVRKTYVAMSVINQSEIEKTLGSSEFAESFQAAPGVFTSRQGGGYGDSRITIRGFSQEDIDVNINGITLKGTEGGWIFWSNWSGMGEYTDRIEVERGLGARALGANAFGGTLNIYTQLPGEKRQYVAGVDVSDALGPKTVVKLSSGRMKNGWAVMAGGTRVKGDGWVEGTASDSWSYYFAASRAYSKKHSLSFRAFGAPQQHDQRSSKLSKTMFDKYGPGHSIDWGMKGGKYYTSAINFFHKPIFTLDHIWKISDASHINTTLSYTMGRGGARRSFGAPLPLDAGGHADFAAAIAANQQNADTLWLGNGQMVTGNSAIYFLGNFRNRHQTYSADTRWIKKLNDKYSLRTGIELRVFATRDWAEVKDLLGADFLPYPANSNFGLQASREGDRIWFSSKTMFDSESLYGQLERVSGKWKSFIFAGAVNSGYQRTDYFNEPDADNQSDRINKLTGRTRIGTSYDITANHTLFVNGGLFVRPPSMETVFIKGIRPPASLPSETIMAVEGGYVYRRNQVTMQFNGYLMQWNDKTYFPMVFDPFTNAFLYPKINGLDATVKGIELDLKMTLLKSLMASFGVSAGDWKWSNDVNAVVQNEKGNTVDTVNVYAKNLKIANSPQTQVFAKVIYSGIKNTWFILDGIYADQLYADFSVTSRTDPAYRLQPYKLPSYFITNVHAGHTVKNIRKTEIAFTGHLNNVFDKQYQNEGIDIPGAVPDAIVFYGLGRNFSVGTRLTF